MLLPDPPIRRRVRQPAVGDIVVMPGSTGVHLAPLQAVAGNFGWKVNVTRDLCEVAAAQASRKTIALLFCRDTLGQGYSWLETIRLLRLALPEVRLIPCYGFSEPIDWPELCDVGAFHALWLPFRENEVRKSLGFVWEAEKRLASAAGRPSEMALAASRSREMRRLAPEVSRGLHAASITLAAETGAKG